MSTATIRLVLDAAAALEDGEVAEHLYMVDDQRLQGSQNQATNRLVTAVSPGDTIIWSIAPIECEVHAGIQAIRVPAEACAVERRFYPDTRISYWVGAVKSASGEVPYELVLEVGNENNLMNSIGASLRVEAASAPPAGDATPPSATTE